MLTKGESIAALVCLTDTSIERQVRTKGSEHGPASVDDLNLAVASEGLGVC